MSGNGDKVNLDALGETRMMLIREAAEKSKGKIGMERMNVFLEYAEHLSAVGSLPAGGQTALLSAVVAGLPEEERSKVLQVISLLELG